MNDDEKRAIARLSDAWSAIIACGAADREAMEHIHALQWHVFGHAMVRRDQANRTSKAIH